MGLNPAEPLVQGHQGNVSPFLFSVLSGQHQPWFCFFKNYSGGMQRVPTMCQASIQPQEIQNKGLAHAGDQHHALRQPMGDGHKCWEQYKTR